MVRFHQVCVLLVCASGCQPGLIGDLPGAPDSGVPIDSSTPPPDASQATIADAAPPDAPAPPPDAAPAPCVEGDARVIDPDTGHCYISYVTAITWVDAQMACADIGTHLVDVTSAAENALALQLAGATDVWMGGNDRAVEGNWMWLSGASLSFSNWRSGEPNNSTGTDTVNGEDCMVLEGARGGSWDDRPCTLRSYGFICERE